MRTALLSNLECLAASTARYYEPFSLTRFALGLSRKPMLYIALCCKLFTCSGYLSTRISGDYEGNVELSKQRQRMLPGILNPACFQCDAVWSGKEYMVMWYTVLTLLRLMNKPIVCFEEDLAVSRGVNLEVLYATKIGMTVLVL